MKRRWIPAASIACSVALALWLLPAGRDPSPVAFASPQAKKTIWPLDVTAPERARLIAIHQAKVWTPPPDIRAADFTKSPPDPAGTLSDPTVLCRYLDAPVHGTTAKFDCVLRDGEVVKVKYGWTPEIHAEIAASRLLAALGFGADRMFFIPRLRCFGCVRTPFYINWALDYVHARTILTRSIPEDRYTDFEWVAVERPFRASIIKAGDLEGWGWDELEPIDPSRGATRVERDALRLAAMLIAHWDNKADNQRLVCLAPPPAALSPCPRPFAFIQDLGATFGPNKVNLENWKAARIWTDRARCVVSMKQFPYDGGTFPDSPISEAGRRLIARELTALSETQMLGLFSGARFTGSSTALQEWVSVFRDKIRQIADGPACPS